MSTELYLTCQDCKHAIWAGCDGLFRTQFLYANQVEMKALGEFLCAHMHHKLQYVAEQYVNNDRDDEFRVYQAEKPGRHEHLWVAPNDDLLTYPPLPSATD